MFSPQRETIALGISTLKSVRQNIEGSTQAEYLVTSDLAYEKFTRSEMRYLTRASD